MSLGLVLKVAVLLSFLCWLGVMLHIAFILKPQIRELKRKMTLPEFAGSFHYKTMEVALQRLQQGLSLFHRIVIVLGLASIGLAAAVLR